MTAEDVKNSVGLVPHPREGGWYIRTYESPEMLDAHVFSDSRYASPRRTGTAIYYLLESDTFSEMHRLRSDEIFHFYAGDPVDMLQLLPGAKARCCASAWTWHTASGHRLLYPAGYGKARGWRLAVAGLCWGAPLVLDLSLRTMRPVSARICLLNGPIMRP
ncbi:MAG TPA: cupin domain-containing protein [Acidobacteriaceae bacterium]|nr:cupin domain-containing protein [Acidobacteriaceae bacterium]